MTTIVKGDGTREEFNIQKLEQSLRRSGAPVELTGKIAERVGRAVKDGMTTSEIYRSAFSLLHKQEGVFAARYSMRRALLDMGPTGFPFEDYFGELMRARGYEAQVRQHIQGKCTSHEVDVVLKKDGRVIGAELKFHNVHGFKTDLKTALYVRARFTDIETLAKERGEEPSVREAWLVTNTKFTIQAIEYAECAGVTLLGWSHPATNNLADIIEETKLYPITVLTQISRKEEAQLLMRQVTLCRDIAKNPEVLREAGIPRRKHQDIVSESVQLCGA